LLYFEQFAWLSSRNEFPETRNALEIGSRDFMPGGAVSGFDTGLDALLLR
jgi:hypothetical protein